MSTDDVPWYERRENEAFDVFQQKAESLDNQNYLEAWVLLIAKRLMRHRLKAFEREEL